MGLRIAGIVATSVALATLAGVAGAGPKKAPPPDASERERKAEAQALGKKGRAALAAKRFEDAEDALRRSGELVASPQVDLDRARALVGLKRYQEARAILRGLVDAAPKQVAAAAKAQLAGVEKKMPQLKVAIVGAPAAQTRVSVDGKEVDASSEIALDPGEHEVTAEAPGFYRLARRVRVAEGQHANEEMKLSPTEPVAAAPKPAEAPAATASPPAEPKEDERAGSGGYAPAVVAFGLGAAGIGVGVGFGLMASSQTDDVKARCNGTRCPKSAEDGLAEARRTALISTIGFIAGGACIAGGVVLLIVRPGKHAPSEGDRGAYVTPVIGPSVIGARGAF